jgi:hypothetical protein
LLLDASNPQPERAHFQTLVSGQYFT